MGGELKYVLTLDNAAFEKAAAVSKTSLVSFNAVANATGGSANATNAALKNLSATKTLLSATSRTAATAGVIFGGSLATTIVYAQMAAQQIKELISVLRLYPAAAGALGTGALAATGVALLGYTGFKGLEAANAIGDALDTQSNTIDFFKKLADQLKFRIEEGVKQGLYSAAQGKEWIHTLFSSGTVTEFAANVARVLREVRAQTLSDDALKQLRDITGSALASSLNGPVQALAKANEEFRKTIEALDEIESKIEGRSDVVSQARSAVRRQRDTSVENIRGSFTAFSQALSIDGLTGKEKQRAQIQANYMEEMKKLAEFVNTGLFSSDEINKAKNTALANRDKQLAEVDKIQPYAGRPEVTPFERLGFVRNSGVGTGDHQAVISRNTTQLVTEAQRTNKLLNDKLKTNSTPTQTGHENID